MSIKTADIAELRERTGAGLAACKNALLETEGDLNKAADLLRQKGLAAAAKKSGKVAAEGAVVAQVSADGQSGVLLELNSQTDFVAKNEKFIALREQIAATALSQQPADLTALKAAKGADGETIENLISMTVAQIGEKIDLRRYQLFTASAGEQSLPLP